MSTSSVACFDFAVPLVKRPARKASRQSLFAGIAVIVLVAGCGWTVYANVFAADPYPQVDSSSFESPFARRWVDLTPRKAVNSDEPRFAPIEPSETIVPESLADAEPTLSFSDRFAASSPRGVAPAPVLEEPTKLAVAPQPAPLKLAETTKAKAEPARNSEAPKRVQLASASPAAQVDDEAPKSGVDKIREMAARAKSAIFGIGSADRQGIVAKLWGKGTGPHNPVLAYASADAGDSVTGSIAPREQNPMMGGSPPYDRDTAVYDIVAHTVYLPDGSKLEAHSGLGPDMDDPHSARFRMRGVTPPHIYTLKPRESLFHGVAALRLTPVGGEDAIFGREGLLAHSFMLGPNGASNGCVSFRDYNAFLSAYHSMGIRKLAVVAHVD